MAADRLAERDDTKADGSDQVSKDGRWSGGIANREWNRAAGQLNLAPITDADAHQLYLDQRDNSFYCETCGAAHPLREHRLCRHPPRAHT